MKIPTHLRIAAAMTGAAAAEFAVGWANGLVRWEFRTGMGEGDGHGRKRLILPANNFLAGSTRFAASEAAVTFMREQDR